MLFGASYYYEYQSYERLADDIRMMRDAGFSFVRVGDSIWSLCEPEDGRLWRLVAYTYISRGANALAYWHWHTLHYGAETYWGGVVNHDLEPNRCYREISSTAIF